MSFVFTPYCNSLWVVVLNFHIYKGVCILEYLCKETSRLYDMLISATVMQCVYSSASTLVLLFVRLLHCLIFSKEKLFFYVSILFI